MYSKIIFIATIIIILVLIYKLYECKKLLQLEINNHKVCFQLNRNMMKELETMYNTKSEISTIKPIALPQLNNSKVYTLPITENKNTDIMTDVVQPIQNKYKNTSDDSDNELLFHKGGSAVNCYEIKTDNETNQILSEFKKIIKEKSDNNYLIYEDEYINTETFAKQVNPLATTFATHLLNTFSREMPVKTTLGGLPDVSDVNMTLEKLHEVGDAKVHALHEVSDVNMTLGELLEVSDVNMTSGELPEVSDVNITLLEKSLDFPVTSSTLHKILDNKFKLCEMSPELSHNSSINAENSLSSNIKLNINEIINEDLEYVQDTIKNNTPINILENNTIINSPVLIAKDSDNEVKLDSSNSLKKEDGMVLEPSDSLKENDVLINNNIIVDTIEENKNKLYKKYNALKLDIIKDLCVQNNIIIRENRKYKTKEVLINELINATIN